MNALLLAAGYATRLYPLTVNTPKPLLPVAGKPIAQYMVDQLAAIGDIDRLLLLTNHRFADHFRVWARSATVQDTTSGFKVTPRFQIEVVDDGTDSNDTRLGAIGDIAFTLQRFPELGACPLFVLGGDNLVDFQLADLVAAFRERNVTHNMGRNVGREPATVVCLVHTEDAAQLRRSGVVTLDANGRVAGFIEKPAEPPSDLTCPPFYIFPPVALSLMAEYLAAGESPDAPGHFIAWLHRRAPVYGHVFAEARYDIGTPASYAEACRIFTARTSSAGATSPCSPSAII